MKLLLAFLLSLAHADVLMLDLNNADGENNACVSSDPDGVWVVNQKTMGVPRITPAVVEAAIKRMEAAGKPIDTIVISGHDGNGEFFGGDHEENSFSAADLNKILNKYKTTKANLKNMALWGCYTGNVSAAENYWLDQAAGGAVFTIGFPVQSPNKFSKPSQKLLGEFCKPEKRAAAAKAVTKEALCEFYKNMPMLRQLDASVSNCSAVATRWYGKDECYSFDELKARCNEFDPGDEMKNLYANYMAGGPGYEDPPLDGDDVYADRGKTPLRKYYDQIHLWRQCYDTLQKNWGYEMPAPAQVIRLVKYKQIKDNLNRLNRRELNDYDARLRALGLGSLALGDLSGQTRGQINAKVNAAVRQLDYMAERGMAGADGTRADAVWKMARGVKSALVDLQYKVRDAKGRQYRCTHFSLVHAGATDPGKRSQCIMSYQQAVNSL